MAAGGNSPARVSTPIAIRLTLRAHARLTRPTFSFRRNSRGFPVLFWHESTTTEELTLLAAYALLRSGKCHQGQPILGSTSVLTVLFFWAWYLTRFDDTDELTGLRMGFNLPVRGSLAPTLLAHATHGVSMNLGWTTPFPRRFDDVDPESVNVYVQTWKINNFVKSWRFPTLVCILQDFRASSFEI